MQTLIGVYPSHNRMSTVVNKLTAQADLNPTQLCYYSDNNTLDHAKLSNSQRLERDALRSTLSERGVPDSDISGYLKEIDRGKEILVLTVPDEQLYVTQRLLNGKEIAQKNAFGRNVTQDTEARTAKTGEAAATLPVIEEDVQVSKTRHQTGGVKARQVVTETPIRETVRLEKEVVEVERRAVDRPVNVGDVELVDQTIEVREHAEQLHVEKDARVVEEVRIHKDVEVETAQVDEVERRIDVEIEPLDAQTAEQRFTALEGEFRQHHQQTYGSQGSWESYRPAYQVGVEHSAAQAQSFDEVEPVIRSAYMTPRRDSEDWQSYREAARFGYERSRRDD